MIKIKSTVRVPRSLIILAAAANTLEVLNFNHIELYVTSGNDSKHMEGSKHYTDEALDFRSKTFQSDERQPFIDELQGRLGIGYQVILENEGESNEHFHVEFDEGKVGS